MGVLMRLYGLAFSALLATASAAGAASITAADISIGSMGSIGFALVDDAAVPSENTLRNTGGAIEVNLLTGSTFEIVFDATGNDSPFFPGEAVRLEDLQFDMPAAVTGAELTSGTAELISAVLVADTSIAVLIPDYVLVDNPVTPFFDRRQVWEFAVTIEATDVAVPLPAGVVLLLTGLAGLATAARRTVA
ncbi:MAG: VPLPA-CTERM sorting domain-containing protein [Pseudomonadota bacterium]